MIESPLNSGNLVDLVELAHRLGLPWEWLRDEAEHARIPRLVATGARGRRFYFFNPQAVRDCLAMRAALGDKTEPARKVVARKGPR